MDQQLFTRQNKTVTLSVTREQSQANLFLFLPLPAFDYFVQFLLLTLEQTQLFLRKQINDRPIRKRVHWWRATVSSVQNRRSVTKGARVQRRADFSKVRDRDRALTVPVQIDGKKALQLTEKPLRQLMKTLSTQPVVTCSYRMQQPAFRPSYHFRGGLTDAKWRMSVKRWQRGRIWWRASCGRGLPRTYSGLFASSQQPRT